MLPVSDVERIEKIKLFPMVGRKPQAKAVDMAYTIFSMLSVMRDNGEPALFDTVRVNVTEWNIESEALTA